MKTTTTDIVTAEPKIVAVAIPPAPAKAEDAEAIRHRRARIALGL